MTNRVNLRNVIALQQKLAEMGGKSMGERRTRGERLQIMLAPAELAAIEEFRFNKHMPSRAAAVRELLKRGLAAEGFLTAEHGVQSKDFGVVGPSDSSGDTD